MIESVWLDKFNSYVLYTNHIVNFQVFGQQCWHLSSQIRNLELVFIPF